jgi:hypothetical protein
MGDARLSAMRRNKVDFTNITVMSLSEKQGGLF